MIAKLRNKNTILSWIGPQPNGAKQLAIVVPQFNESSSSPVVSRLQYFHRLRRQHDEVLDVVLIDDGSTDDSLDHIKQFQNEHPHCFHICSVSPNANKVGAIFMTIQSLQHEFIILTDFDTDIEGLNHVSAVIRELNSDGQIMGCYFRMSPHERKGLCFRFQQLDYCLARTMYKLHKAEKSVPVMPGAGCCYKRPVLLSIYNHHSGLRSGEDREATTLGHKLGFKATYFEQIRSLTRPPETFAALVRQRRRWNLGYIETVYKEHRFYYDQLKQLRVIGIRTVLDLTLGVAAVVLPMIVFAEIVLNFKTGIKLFILGYLVMLAWPTYAYIVAPNESVDLKRHKLSTLAYFPIYKVALDFLGWSLAFVDFCKSERVVTGN